MGLTELANTRAEHVRPNRCCGSDDHVTAREIEILVAVSQGSSNSAIGRQLHVSEATTRAYLTRWYQRVGAANRAELVARAVCAGLIDATSWPPRATGTRCIAKF